MRDPLSERVHLASSKCLAIASAASPADWRAAPRAAGPCRDNRGLRMSAETAASNAGVGIAASAFVLCGDAYPAAAQRDAMFLIYSFCRQVDDIADSDGPRGAQGGDLQQWRKDIDALYRQAAVAARGLSLHHQALRPAARGFPCHHRRHGDGRAAGHPRAGLGDARSLLRPRRQRRRPSVGQRVRHAADDGVALAHHLGRALQLTNILRDIDEDAAIGRLYLPREALDAAGITSTDPGPWSPTQTCRKPVNP